MSDFEIFQWSFHGRFRIFNTSRHASCSLFNCESAVLGHHYLSTISLVGGLNPRLLCGFVATHGQCAKTPYQTKSLVLPNTLTETQNLLNHPQAWEPLDPILFSGWAPQRPPCFTVLSCEDQPKKTMSEPFEKLQYLDPVGEIFWKQAASVVFRTDHT